MHLRSMSKSRSGRREQLRRRWRKGDRRLARKLELNLKDGVGLGRSVSSSNVEV